MSPKQFGKIMYRERVYYGKSLTILSKETGISKGNLSKIDNGIGNPCLETMNKIAKSLFFKIQTNT